RQRFPQGLGQAEGLADDGRQLVVDGALRIGRVQLLVALPLDFQHTATGQARQLTLYGAAAGAGELDQLADAVTPARLAEQVREDALLRLREQRIGQVGPRVDRGGLTDPIVRLPA